jgi:hypothetical protein
MQGEQSIKLHVELILLPDIYAAIKIPATPDENSVTWVLVAEDV